MKCDNPWDYKFTRIVPGKPPEDLFLCRAHAQEMSPTVNKNLEVSLVGIIQQLISHQQEGVSENEDPQGAGRTCARCRLSYSQYRKTLLLGCCDCYTSFEDLLLKDLRKFHGAVSQTAEDVQIAPEAPGEGEEAGEKKIRVAPEEQAGVISLSVLKKQIKEAVEKEDFERAAMLRDAIRDLESRQAKKKKSSR